MATFLKRQGKRGVRWTARVRVRGHEVTDTFGTLAAAKKWARAQETALESGVYRAADPSQGAILADLIDATLKHRQQTRRPVSATYHSVVKRIKDDYGLMPADDLGGNEEFWRRHVLDRIADGVTSQTAVNDLAYVGSVLAHAKREKLILDASGPSRARALVKDDGLRVVSRQRARRISDDELAALLTACEAVETGLPLGDIVRVLLCTAMRRGEVLRLRWADLDAKRRVALVRNRKHPSDKQRVDEVPLLKVHAQWPPWDALRIIEAQPRNRDDRIFPYPARTFQGGFGRACKLAELRGVMPHLLRHEALSRYAERGFDVLRLQLVGGHRDLKALQRYVQMSASDLALGE